MKKVLLLALTLSAAITASAQGDDLFANQDSSVVNMDDIRFEATTFTIDSAMRTATVTVTLTCLTERSRELKMNVYGTQLVDNKRNAYYFSTVTLGRVLMRFEDRQNYLHYLLLPDTPVELTITAQGISPEAIAIQVVKVVFEDSRDEGRFLEAYLTPPVAP